MPCTTVRRYKKKVNGKTVTVRRHKRKINPSDVPKYSKKDYKNKPKIEPGYHVGDIVTYEGDEYKIIRADGTGYSISATKPGAIFSGYTNLSGKGFKLVKDKKKLSYQEELEKRQKTKGLYHWETKNNKMYRKVTPGGELYEEVADIQKDCTTYVKLNGRLQILNLVEDKRRR